MKSLSLTGNNKKTEYLFSIGLVLIVSGLCFHLKAFLGYREVALILLMNTSLQAMLFDISVVLSASILSALIWNFLFIPPLFTFHIEQREDILLFLLYFVIALLNAILTNKIRKAEQKLRDKEEKEKTIKLYNTLINSLSHELRTPIATIIGAVDTMKVSGGKISEENKDHLLSEIGIAGLRLNRQVENLLNMSRLESGILQAKSEWFDLSEHIQSLIEKFELNQQKRILFQKPKPVFLIQSDEGLLEQILLNLLHNALLYTHNESEINIQIASREHHCIIKVSDNGPGFPENEIAKVFDKFYRLNHTKS
jgi:two-component system sensor histidine kinase KdpD